MSVAPNSRARRCRRLVAAHGDDPLGAELLGRQYGEQTDGAVADHGDGLAGAGLGGDGAEPAGAEDVGGRQQARDEVVGRDVGRGDQRAVGQRDAQQVGLGAQRAHRHAVHAGALVAGAADLARVVGRPERADDELARLDRRDGVADFLDDAGVLVAHRHRPHRVLDPDAAVGPQVRAAHAGGRDADDRVGRLDDLRRFALLDPDLARAVHHRAAHHAAAFASSWARLVDSSRCASTCASSSRALSSTPSTTSSPAAQRSGGSVGVGQLDERPGELGRVAGLLAVHRGPEGVDSARASS